MTWYYQPDLDQPDPPPDYLGLLVLALLAWSWLFHMWSAFFFITVLLTFLFLIARYRR